MDYRQQPVSSLLTNVAQVDTSSLIHRGEFSGFVQTIGKVLDIFIPFAEGHLASSCFDFCADGQGIKTLEYLQDLVFRSSIVFFLLIFSIYHIFYLSTPPFLIYTRISYELQDSTMAIQSV